MAKLVKHKVTLSGNPVRAYFFLAPKGTYTGAVGTECGIAEAEAADFDQPNVAVKELLRCNTVTRLKVRAVKNNKVYQLSLLCSASKEITVKDGLKGKTVGTDGTVSEGATIQQVVTPRKAVSY